MTQDGQLTQSSTRPWRGRSASSSRRPWKQARTRLRAPGLAAADPGRPRRKAQAGTGRGSRHGPAGDPPAGPRHVLPAGA